MEYIYIRHPELKVLTKLQQKCKADTGNVVITFASKLIKKSHAQSNMTSYYIIPAKYFSIFREKFNADLENTYTQ